MLRPSTARILPRDQPNYRAATLLPDTTIGRRPRVTLSALPKLSFGWTDDPKYLETAQGDFHEAMFGDDVREHPDVKPIMSCRGFAPAHLVEYPKGEGVYCIMDLVSGEVMRILRPSELEDIVSLLKDESLGGIEFEAVDPENRAQFAEVDARELGGSVG